MFTDRFESYYSLINYILKVGKNKFHVRRKTIFWFKGKFKKLPPKETLGQMISKKINEYEDTYEKSVLIISTSINEPIYFFLNFMINRAVYVNPQPPTMLTKHGVRSYLRSILYFYTYLLNSRSVLFRSFSKEHNKYAYATYSQPKKQLFVSILSPKAGIVISSGVLRLVLNIDRKCAKKQKNVTNATLKFSSMFIRNRLRSLPIILKIIRNITLSPKLIKQMHQHKISGRLWYILFEPKIQTDCLNRKRQSDIKKRIRKSRKYRGD